jgi:CRP-like cAMP-binding protein
MSFERPALVLEAKFVKSGHSHNAACLSFQKNDLVEIWGQRDARMMFGMHRGTGHVGLFPVSCVELITPADVVPPPPPPPQSAPRRRHSAGHRRRRSSASSSSSSPTAAAATASRTNSGRRRSQLSHGGDALSELRALEVSLSAMLDDDNDADDDDDDEKDEVVVDVDDNGEVPDQETGSSSSSESESPPPPPSSNNPLVAAMDFGDQTSSLDDDDDDDDDVEHAELPQAEPLVPAVPANAGNAERRFRVAAELLQTERTYVESLSVLVELYMVPLQQASPAILSAADVSKIFDSVNKVRDCNVRFLRALEQRVEPWGEANCVGDVVLGLLGELDCYLQFTNMFDLATKRVGELLTSNKAFAQFCQSARENVRSKRLDVGAYLIAPIQRIPRYVMLLADLAKSTASTHADAAPLRDAEQRMRDFADAMNQRKRERDADDANRVLAARFDALEFRLAEPGRMLITQGAAIASDGFDTADGSPSTGESQRVVFLFSDILLCAAPARGDRLVLVWKLSLGSCELTTTRLDGNLLKIALTEARWQPTPPFTVPTQRSFTVAVGGGGGAVSGRAAPDWLALVSAQIADQRKVYRPPANKRGAWFERHMLSAGEWVLLSVGSVTRSLADGQVLIEQDAPFAGLFVVLDGLVEVQRQVRGQWLTLDTCGAGALLGELSYLSGSSSCRCVARAAPGTRGVTQVRRLNEDVLGGLLEAQSDLSEHFFTLLCVRIGNLQLKLALRDALAAAGDAPPAKAPASGSAAAARPAANLGRVDAERARAVADKLQLDVASGAVLVKSWRCVVRRKALKASCELHLFDSVLALTYKLFGLSQRVVVPWADLREVELAPQQISLHYNSAERAVLAFDSADVAREAFSAIEGLRGVRPAGGSRRISLAAGGAAPFDAASLALYGDLAPRDASLLLNESDWQQVFESAETRELKLGDVVLAEGEQYQRLWQLGEHSTCSVRVGERRVAELKAGEIFGEISFLLGGGASASIVCSSETATVIFVERTRLQRLFDANQMLAAKWYKFLALSMQKRLREREQDLLE